MISIIDLVGEDALYSKTVSWVSSIILHIDTDTDTDNDTDIDTGGSIRGYSRSRYELWDKCAIVTHFGCEITLLVLCDWQEPIAAESLTDSLAKLLQWQALKARHGFCSLPWLLCAVFVWGVVVVWTLLDVVLVKWILINDVVVMRSCLGFTF